MTFEKKCFIKPEDILAVRLVCGNCKASLTIPIEKLASANLQIVLTRNCPHCQTAYGFGIGTSQLEHVVTFNILLSRLGELLKGMNLEYGFEIECGKQRSEDAE